MPLNRLGVLVLEQHLTKLPPARHGLSVNWMQEAACP